MDTIGSILKMCFIVDFSFRGEIPGVRGFIKVQNLPATVTIKEDTPAGVAIFNFSVVSTSIEISLTPKIADTNPVNNFFAISIISDMYLEVTVSDNPGLDYETHSNYVLLIYVTDNKGYSDFGTLTVLLSDVNEPPRFLDNLANGVVYVDFLENLAVGAIIYEVQAIDPDRDDNILSIPETIEKGTTVVTISCADNDVDLANSQFTISLQPALRTAGRFALDGKNNDTIVVFGNLDFEATSHLEDNNVYVMSVVVTDKAHPHYQDTVTVYVTVIPVNEFNPSFTQTSYTFNISEFSEMGTKIGQVLAEDKDLPSLELIYSLVGGGSTLGYSQLFWMNPASGELHLVAQPEYEQTAQYLLTVQAVDKDSNDPKAATATWVRLNCVFTTWSPAPKEVNKKGAY
ncbi:hypothetical protein chiPu_0020190 [Chiloscyllium punctatum]|uniref:Cadherin domain-containing protein n=1 Tax=Chiloscyllium punctatum TaxID=137246 RepID=A0A401RU94_CHIPU|nr:hypothetical protein [Chiloscyllium punctatum]